MALALLIPVGYASAQQDGYKEKPDSNVVIVKIKGKLVSYDRDTLFVPPADENPTVAYQNYVYKRRLDSLQSKIPLTYNEHVQDFIDLYVVKRKEQIGRMLGLSEYYFPIFEKALSESGVPDEIKYLAVIESALNPHAVSRVGATGPWQFMYTTAKGYGLTIDNYVDERKDPAAASYAAAAYLKRAHDQFDDWLLAIAAYNCGMGAVSRAVERAGGAPDFWAVRQFLPIETRNYVPAFIATTYVMNYYDKHEISPLMADFSVITDVVDVTKTISIERIAKAANLNVKELNTLNPSYKKRIINGSENSPKRLVIPAVNNDVYASLYDVLNNSPAYIEHDEESAVVAVSTRGKTVKPQFHNVRSGENLSVIANRYGIEVQDLKVWNSLKSGSILPGQNLKISGSKEVVKKKTPEYFTYKVRSGDTLSDIAEKFRGATVSKIKALNGLKRTVLMPGMFLKINKL